MIPLTEIFCLIDDFCKHFDTEQNKYETGLIFQDKFFTNFVSHFT
ncbi:hypothetical protein [Candidatus Tisiphia endosymbiont of Parasteatoda lunata]